MKGAHKALLVVMVATVLGLWGCTQGQGSNTRRLRDLETRNAKLEEDYRTAAAEGAELRQKLVELEHQVAQLRQQAQQLQVVIQERDRLRRQLTSVQNERNQLQARMQEFSRELQALAGRVEAAASNTAVPATSATTAPASPQPSGNL